MQSKEQPASDTYNPTQSNRSSDWPPSLLRLVLGAAVAAGLGYAVLKTMYPIFVVPLEIATFPEQSPAWMYERLEKAQYEIDGKNLSIVFGVIGAIFGASCVVFSFGARSGMAFAFAIVGSACTGVAGAFLSNWMFNNMRANSGKNATIMGVSLDGMSQSIIGYSLLWGLIGLSVGLGIGSVRGVRKTLVAGVSGLVGGTLGAMLYVILISQFSIGTTMNRVLPNGDTSQAIWLLLFTVTIAVCIALGTGEKRQKRTV